ncbi:hypothetical protein KBC31_02965 [Candidatus Saccharibacteria bacterium]|jgi:hypothetical protein|nr:hypothetical protein [Candidatus Saccharibacteria bacterium]
MSLLATLGQFAQDSFETGTTSFDTTTTTAGDAAMGGAIFFGALIIALIIAIPMIIAMWKIFVKAGQPGWASIVPIYNSYVMVQIAGLPILWFILMLVPYVNGIAAIYVLYMLAKSFGKDAGFTALMVLLPFIGFPILGFGKAQYLGPAGPAGSVAPVAAQNQAGVPQFPSEQNTQQNDNQGFGAPVEPSTPPVQTQPNDTFTNPQDSKNENQNPPQTPPTFG